MYCSSCGSAVANGLRYCNQCGAELSISKPKTACKPNELFPESLIWAMVAVFVVGLGCAIGLMAVMKDYNFEKGQILGFTGMVLFLTLALEGVFVGMLSGRRNKGAEVVDIGQLKQHETKVLNTPSVRELSEPVPSITEHTTRAFEPLHRERKSI